MSFEEEVVAVVKERGVLNTMQICRALNGRERCNEGYFDGWRGNDRDLLRLCKENSCKIKYFEVLKKLRKMDKRGKIKSEKRWYYDKGYHYHGKKKIDLFRFYYVDDEVFYKRIIANTLEAWGVK